MSFYHNNNRSTNGYSIDTHKGYKYVSHSTDALMNCVLVHGLGGNALKKFKILILKSWLITYIVVHKHLLCVTPNTLKYLFIAPTMTHVLSNQLRDESIRFALALCGERNGQHKKQNWRRLDETISLGWCVLKSGHRVSVPLFLHDAWQAVLWY